MKSIDKTFTWHFVDIPLGVVPNGAKTPDISQWCEPIGPSINGKDRPGCLTSAIDYEWSILRDRSRSGPDRAKALLYVVHFLGDLSQPLHNTDNHDQGGNCTRITFFGAEKLENLHAIWDERIIARDLARSNETQTQYAAELDRQFRTRWDVWGKAKTDVVAWAWEGHELARTVTYGKLRPQIPVVSPPEGQTDRAGCDAGRAKVEAMHISIGDEYVQEALPVIREQLAKAGYRLAGMLNQSF
jgi:hypothetical protein